MIRLLLALCFFCALGSCKKIKEQVQENRAMDFITSGQWKVTTLKKAATDYSTAFNPYQFKFRSDGRVDALNGGVVEISGNWSGDVNTGTIVASFPSNAQHPLPLLNGSWQITDGSSTFTTATKTENGETSLLRLDKI